jgi:hypothetical protein
MPHKVSADRFKLRAIDRKDICARRPLDITSRSIKVDARRDRKRSGGRDAARVRKERVN